MDQLTAMAFGVSLVGGIHDLLTKKIPNWLTFSAIFIGLVAQFWLFGFAGLLDSFLGLSLGFGIFFPVYVLGYMGAGDVKLLMAVGACTGWHFCLRVAIASVIVGGAYALVEIIFRGRLVYVAKRTFYFLRALFLPELVAEPLKLDENRKFAFGICVAIAVASIIFLQNSGRLP